MEDVNTMKINNLCVAITFHYNPNRLKFLEQVTSHIDDLANKVKLFIITNEHEENYIREIEKSTAII
jgi:hypothetical protein